MNEIEESKENEITEEQKIEVKEKENQVDNSKSTNQQEKEDNKKPTEETLIIPENKSKSLGNDENSLINNKSSSSPLIDDNIYLNKLKDDHYILIEHTKFLNIPYFVFGFTTHFYYPSEKLQGKIKLSEIPNPPFTLGEDCKFIIYIIN